MAGLSLDTSSPGTMPREFVGEEAVNHVWASRGAERYSNRGLSMAAMLSSLCTRS